MRIIVYWTDSVIFKFPQADTLLLLRFRVVVPQIDMGRTGGDFSE
jgi:hypothetical protein